MVELEDFKYGGTNISSLRLVDPSDENVLGVVQDWVKGEMRFNRKIPFAGKTIRVCEMCFYFQFCDEKQIEKKEIDVGWIGISTFTIFFVQS